MNYRDLEIYQLAHELATAVHKLTLLLPKYETYEEGSQIRRSSKSICANIVEGFCRRRYKIEFVRFLVFAWGSCEETLEHLRLLRDTGSLTQQQCLSLESDYQKLSAKVCSFIRSVEKEHKT